MPGVAETLDWAAALVGLDVARPARRTGSRARNHRCASLKTHEDKFAPHARGHPAHSGESGMSCCGAPPTLDEMDEVSRLVSASSRPSCARCATPPSRSALREGQDACNAPRRQAMARSPVCCARRFKHLFSARKAERGKFDGIFDAFWLGTRVRSRVATNGRAGQRQQPRYEGHCARTRPEQGAGSGARPGPRRPARPARTTARRRPRRRRIARRESIAETDFRKLADPADIARGARRRRAPRPRHAHAADAAATSPAGAATGSTSAVPSTGTSAMAACRSTW